MFRTIETDKIHHVRYPYQLICSELNGYQDGTNAEETPVQFLSATILEKWAQEDSPYEIIATLSFSYDVVYTERFRDRLIYLHLKHMNTLDPPFAFSFDHRRGIVTVYHTTFVI